LTGVRAPRYRKAFYTCIPPRNAVGATRSHPAEKGQRTVSDYISLIGFMGLMFVPLYIPVAVTIVGGIRRGRDAVGATRPVVGPPAIVARGIDGVLPSTARPIVEPV
jgi:hypothetical protein